MCVVLHGYKHLSIYDVFQMNYHIRRYHKHDLYRVVTSLFIAVP